MSTSSNQAGITPPSAPDLETGLIGVMLMETETIHTVFSILHPDDFHDRRCRIAAEVIREMSDKGKPLDAITLESELDRRNVLQELGGPGAAVTFLEGASAPTAAEYHSQVVREYAIRRQLIRHSGEWQKQAFDTTADAYEVLDAAEQQLMDLSSGLVNADGRRLTDKLPEVLSNIRNRKFSEGVTGVGANLTDLDRLTAGWQQTDLIILAARPSMGKTALALHFAKQAALSGVGCGVFSLEMSDDQLTERFLVTESGLDATKVRAGGLNDSEMQRLERAKKELQGLNIVINDDAALNVMQLRSTARKWKREQDIGLVIVDYLQLLTSPDRSNRTQNREQEISKISRSLKALAKELRIPVISLSQLSRQVEQRPNKRPMLSDLRESGSIEQDADVVMFVYRPEYYGIDTDDAGFATAGAAELIVAKQRNGPTGSAKVNFEKTTGRFTNRTTQQAPQPAFDELLDEEPF